MCFTKSTFQMLISSRNTITDTPRLMFNQMTGYLSPVKLTHKINHHTKFQRTEIFVQSQNEGCNFVLQGTQG